MSLPSQVLGTDSDAGISGFGTTISGAVAGPIGQVTKVGLEGQDVTDIDITTMNAPSKWMKFVAGLKDAKTLQLELLYGPLNTNTLLAALGGATQVWTITLPDTCSFAVTGYIKSLGTQIPLNDKISQTCVIRLSGPPVFHIPSGVT